MNQIEIQKFTRWLGKRSYPARLKRFGLERLQEIARCAAVLDLNTTLRGCQLKKPAMAGCGPV